MKNFIFLIISFCLAAPFTVTAQEMPVTNKVTVSVPVEKDADSIDVHLSRKDGKWAAVSKPTNGGGTVTCTIPINGEHMIVLLDRQDDGKWTFSCPKTGEYVYFPVDKETKKAVVKIRREIDGTWSTKEAWPTWAVVLLTIFIMAVAMAADKQQ